MFRCVAGRRGFVPGAKAADRLGRPTRRTRPAFRRPAGRPNQPTLGPEVSSSRRASLQPSGPASARAAERPDAAPSNRGTNSREGRPCDCSGCRRTGSRPFAPGLLSGPKSNPGTGARRGPANRHHFWSPTRFTLEESAESQHSRGLARSSPWNNNWSEAAAATKIPAESPSGRWPARAYG